MTWIHLLKLGDAENAVALGIGGSIPAPPALEQADFLVPLPFALSLFRLKATMKVPPTANTTFQLRKSADGGVTWANVFGSVTVLAGQRVGVSAPATTTIAEGELLNFSVTAGDGSGGNATILAIGRK